MSDAGRESFFWKHPGRALKDGGDDDEACTNIPKGGRGADGKVVPPPSNFLLLLLRPDHVDYLRLSDNVRFVFEKQRGMGVWTTTEVHP